MKAPMLAMSLLAALATPALAANADAPNQNVDKTNDAGNATGNAQTDRLNTGQLDRNQPPPAGSQPAPPAK